MRYGFVLFLMLAYSLSYSPIYSQGRSSFGFDSGYWTSAHTIKTKIESSLEAAVTEPHPEKVIAVKVGADSDYLSEIGKLTSVKFLYLDKTFTTNSYYLKDEAITAFFNLVRNLPNLEYVSIYDAKLLPFMTGLNLKGLKLHRYDSESFRDHILRFTSLELLIFRDPDMVVLPEEIGGLSNLRQLEMYTLNLTVLPPSISNLNNLLVLKLMVGKMQNLPEDFGRFKQLKYLSITGLIFFRKFPSEICELTTLVELEVDLRKVNIISDDIGGLKQLKKLSFGECQQLQKLPSTIDVLPVLEEIYLGDAENIVNLDELSLILHPFTLILNRCRYVKLANLTVDIANMKAMAVPSDTLPSILKKLNKILGEERVLLVEY